MSPINPRLMCFLVLLPGCLCFSFKTQLSAQSMIGYYFGTFIISATCCPIENEKNSHLLGQGAEISSKLGSTSRNKGPQFIKALPAKPRIFCTRGMPVFPYEKCNNFCLPPARVTITNEGLLGIQPLKMES